MTRKAIQAKHVDERAILEALGLAREAMTHWHGFSVAGLAVVPEKVLRAKLCAMKRRGLIDGCGCGCRGDWTITARGREALA